VYAVQHNLPLPEEEEPADGGHLKTSSP